MKILATLACAVPLLVACGGGDGHEGASACQSIGHNYNYLTTTGGIDNPQAMADGSLGTFATFDSNGSGNYVTSKGVSFSGGTQAGVFITPPKGATATDITVSTFMTQEQATVESATGPTLTITPTPDDPSTEYVSFKTTVPFNGVRLQINTATTVQYLVFEICGDATVR